MFCLKCGKTLKSDAVQCPYCASPVGETLFTGLQYTSCQPRIMPGQKIEDTPASAQDTEFDESRTAYRVQEDRPELTREQREQMRESARTGVFSEPEETEEPEVSEEVRAAAREKMRRYDDDFEMEGLTIDRSQLEIRPIEMRTKKVKSEEVGAILRGINEGGKKKSRAELRREREQEELREEQEELLREEAEKDELGDEEEYDEPDEAEEASQTEPAAGPEKEAPEVTGEPEETEEESVDLGDEDDDDAPVRRRPRKEKKEKKAKKEKKERGPSLFARLRSGKKRTLYDDDEDIYEEEPADDEDKDFDEIDDADDGYDYDPADDEAYDEPEAPAPAKEAARPAPVKESAAPAPEEDAPAQDIPQDIPEDVPQDYVPDEDEYPEDEAEPEDDEAAEPETDEYDDSEYYGRTSRFGLNPNMKKIGLIVLAVIAAAAVFVGGFLLIRGKGGVGGSGSTVAGVTESLYSEGIKALRENVTDESIQECLGIYSSEGYMSMTIRLSAEVTALQNLLPETPMENDALFVKALVHIQENIASNLIMDANGSNPDSRDTWNMIKKSIDTLANAKSAEDIERVINGETVTVQATATPAPESTPFVYTTLSKGDKGDQVLKLQTRLQELGYFNDTRDGDFGTKTQTAVKMFQLVIGVDTTGVADNATLTRLYADDAPVKPAEKPTGGD